MECLLQPPLQRQNVDAASILIVDDELPICRVLGQLLELHGYSCTLAASAAEARAYLDLMDFALILCDVNMPGQSGVDLIRQTLAERPNLAAVMVTGVDNPALADTALEAGAYGYVIKPFEQNEILINVANALRRRRLEMQNREYRQQLEDIVRTRTAALQQSLDWLERSDNELRLSQEETIHRLAIAAEFKDKSTAGHIQRMSQYCALLARKHGLEDQRCELIRIASPMHDIGKIGTPDHVLRKPGKFTQEEFDVISKHPEIGYRILHGSEAEVLNVAATIAYTHHEWFDGTGYPRRLAGSAIPLEGRIAAIADVFDALTSQRVYKPAYSIEEALRVMQEKRAKHFDPELLDLFMASTDELAHIRDTYHDHYQDFPPPSASAS